MSMGVNRQKRWLTGCNLALMIATSFLAVGKPDLAGSAGTKKPVVFLAPQHCQPPPGSRSSQSNTTDASVSPLWADRADCGSVSRNVGTVAAIVGLTPPPVSPNPGRKTR